MAQLNSMHSDGKSLSPPFCPTPTRGSLGKSLKAKTTAQRGWSIACFHRSQIKPTHIEGWMLGQPLREDILTSIGLSGIQLPEVQLWPIPGISALPRLRLRWRFSRTGPRHIPDEHWELLRQVYIISLLNATVHRRLNRLRHALQRADFQRIYTVHHILAAKADELYLK